MNELNTFKFEHRARISSKSLCDNRVIQKLNPLIRALG